MAEDIVDVLIIGAGASGAAVAWSLAETKMRIVCLEQGDWMNPADYPSTRRDWEAQMNGRFSVSPNVRRGRHDYPINEDESPISILNFNGVGGSTVLYSAHFPRLHPSDFRVRSLDGVADDWPIDYAALDPFFAENDRIIGVAGLAGDPAMPEHVPPLPPVPLGLIGETLARGFNTLGWHWWPSDSAIATLQYEGREPASTWAPATPAAPRAPRAAPTSPTGRWRDAPASSCARAAGCARSWSTTTTWRPASSTSTTDGVERRQRAEVVVLACNGVGTPRLLLNSSVVAVSATAWRTVPGWSART